MLRLGVEDVLEHVGQPPLSHGGQPLRVRITKTDEKHGIVTGRILVPTEPPSSGGLGACLFGHIVLAMMADGTNWKRVGRFTRPHLYQRQPEPEFVTDPKDIPF